MAHKIGKIRPTGNFKNYFSEATEMVGAKALHQAIDNEVKNFIIDDPVCSNAEIKYGTGYEKFMERLEREVGFSPRSYKRKTSKQLSISGRTSDGPDIQSRFKFMRSGGRRDLALSCFYLFIVARDNSDYASNIEARVGVLAFISEKSYPSSIREKLAINPNIQNGIIEVLERKAAELRITAQVSTLLAPDGMDIKDNSALLPVSGEQIFRQDDRIFFEVETRRNRSLILLLSDQDNWHWLAPGPSYAGPARSNLERVPTSAGYLLDRAGPHRFIVVELDTLFPTYVRKRYDPTGTVFQHQEGNLIVMLKNSSNWRWGEVLVFVRKKQNRREK